MKVARYCFAAILGCALATLGARSTSSGQAEGLSQRKSPPDVRKLLQHIAGITNAEWSAIERGVAIAKTLDTDTREIAVAGVVRIAAPPESLVARFREIENLKRSAIVLEAGRFGRIPQASDLVSLPIEDYSLDLKSCRPGDCRVRLSAADIERFHRDVDWRAQDWRSRATSVWREVLAGHAAAYLSSGRTGLPVYANKREPLSTASELLLLVRKCAFVEMYSPEFHTYLQEFGPPRLEGAEHTLYWTKEDFGIRPVVRISHQIIHRGSAAAPAVLIATNQVYADHYLDAALGLTLAMAPEGGNGRTFYLIAVNRARTRSLSGVLRAMVRSTVLGRSRDAMQKILTATKAAVEKQQP